MWTVGWMNTYNHIHPCVTEVWWKTHTLGGSLSKLFPTSVLASSRSIASMIASISGSLRRAEGLEGLEGGLGGTAGGLAGLAGGFALGRGGGLGAIWRGAGTAGRVPAILVGDPRSSSLFSSQSYSLMSELESSSSSLNSGSKAWWSFYCYWAFETGVTTGEVHPSNMLHLWKSTNHSNLLRLYVFVKIEMKN